MFIPVIRHTDLDHTQMTAVLALVREGGALELAECEETCKFEADKKCTTRP